LPLQRVRHARTLTLLVAVAAVAGACSAGAGKGLTPVPAPSALATPAPAQSPAPAPTAVDPAAVPLQPDAGAEGAYTIQVPVGWTAENIPAPGGFGRRYTLFVDGARSAQVTVRCERGASIDSLVTTDSRLVGSLQGQYGSGGMADVVVGGLTGRATAYTLVVGGVPQETRAVYLQGTLCGWQILLQAFGRGQLARYTPLFERVLATFSPSIAGG
jgi:hypothetical protein